MSHPPSRRTRPQLPPAVARQGTSRARPEPGAVDAATRRHRRTASPQASETFVVPRGRQISLNGRSIRQPKGDRPADEAVAEGAAEDAQWFAEADDQRRSPKRNVADEAIARQATGEAVAGLTWKPGAPSTPKPGIRPKRDARSIWWRAARLKQRPNDHWRTTVDGGRSAGRKRGALWTEAHTPAGSGCESTHWKPKHGASPRKILARGGSGGTSPGRGGRSPPRGGSRRRKKDEARRHAEAEAASGPEEARSRAEAERQRLAAVAKARRLEQEEAGRRAAARARQRAEEEARRRAEEEARRLAAEAEARRRAEEEAKRRAEAEARQQAGQEATRAPRKKRRLAARN